MNVNGIVNNLPTAQSLSGEKSVSAAHTGRLSGKLDMSALERMALKPSKPSLQELKSRVLSRDDIVQLLSVKNPMPRRDGEISGTGRFIDVRA